MLLNHARRTPRDWNDAEPSLCPDCQAPLIPRRGLILVWHWAHKSAGGGGAGPQCATHETSWHLRWKYAYHTFAGWEIEVPLDCGGQQFRADAMNVRTGRVREFVHSVSDTYVAKHLALRRATYDVMWIFDGDEFSASRRRAVRGGGVKHLLKPRASWLHDRIGGLVHYDDALWRHWKADVWYPLETDTTAELLARFASTPTAERHAAPRT